MSDCYCLKHFTATYLFHPFPKRLKHNTLSRSPSPQKVSVLQYCPFGAQVERGFGPLQS